MARALLDILDLKLLIVLFEPGLIRWPTLLGPFQITEAYLLALAVHHGGRSVNVDQRISLELVPAASTAHLCGIEGA